MYVYHLRTYVFDGVESRLYPGVGMDGGGVTGYCGGGKVADTLSHAAPAKPSWQTHVFLFEQICN